MRLFSVALTDSGDSWSRETLLRASVLGAAFGAAASAGLAVLVGYDASQTTLILLVAAARSADGISLTMYGLHWKVDSVAAPSLSFMARGVASLTCLAVGVLVAGSLILGTAAWAAAWFVILIAYDIPTAWKRSRANVQDTGTLGIVRTAYPLGISQMLVTVPRSAVRVVLEATHGAAALGVFSVVVSLVTAAGMLMSSLGLVNATELARCRTVGAGRRIAQLVLRQQGLALACGLLLFVGITATGSLGLEFVFGPDFAIATPVLLLVAAYGVFLFQNTPLAHVYVAMGAHQAEFRLTLVLSVLTTCVTWSVVSPWGPLGAAGVLAAFECLALLGTTVILGRTLRSLDAEQPPPQMLADPDPAAANEGPNG